MASLLRSAAIAARCARSASCVRSARTPLLQGTTINKAMMSTMAFDSSLCSEIKFNTDDRQATMRSSDADGMSVMAGLKSTLSSMVASFSGDTTVVIVDRTVDQYALESSEEWEVIPTPSSALSATSSMSTIASPMAQDVLESLSLWQISTLKRRKKMMNKHKLQKRRKKLRLKTRK